MAVEANTGGKKVDIVKALLKAGASAATKDSKGRTAASIARDRGFKDVADILEKALAGGGGDEGEDDEEEVVARGKKGSGGKKSPSSAPAATAKKR